MKNFSAISLTIFLFFSGNALPAQEKPVHDSGKNYTDCLETFKEEYHKFCELTDTVTAFAFFEEVFFQLNEEKVKSKRRKTSLIITYIAFSLIGIGSAYYFILYRRKKCLLHVGGKWQDRTFVKTEIVASEKTKEDGAEKQNGIMCPKLSIIVLKRVLIPILTSIVLTRRFSFYRNKIQIV